LTLRFQGAWCRTAPGDHSETCPIAVRALCCLRGCLSRAEFPASSSSCEGCSGLTDLPLEKMALAGLSTRITQGKSLIERLRKIHVVAKWPYNRLSGDVISMDAGLRSLVRQGDYSSTCRLNGAAPLARQPFEIKEPHFEIVPFWNHTDRRRPLQPGRVPSSRFSCLELRSRLIVAQVTRRVFWPSSLCPHGLADGSETATCLL